MLFAMEPELQNRFEEFSGPFEILEELKTMFQTQARLRDMRSLRSSLTAKWRKGVPLVSTPLRCRATLNALSSWTARFQKSSRLTEFCNRSLLATKAL
jgi:hypothetical protein